MPSPDGAKARIGGGRVRALDAVRAVALLLMIVGHVANYSFLWRSTHFPYYVWDGASIFMVVSGIVVAQVNRVRIEISGMAFAARRLARRAGFLYLVQVALVALATATAYFQPSPTSGQFLVPGIETWQDVLPWDVILGANPIYVNFLSSYVVILLAAIPGLWLLSKRRYGLFLTGSVVLYVAGLIWPRFFTLPNGPLEEANFDNATWFTLFASGLIVGWFWRERGLEATLVRTKVVAAALVLVAVDFVFVIWDALVARPGGPIDWLFDKDLMAPGRFVAAWAFFIVLFWIMWRLPNSRAGAVAGHWLAVLGRYPVDTIVILTLMTVATQGLIDLDSSSRLSQVVAILTVLAAWSWAFWRLRR